MVSKARLDLPEPDRPVITTSELRGRRTWTSRRLCSRAPETTSSEDCAIEASLGPGEHVSGCARSHFGGLRANRSHPACRSLDSTPLRTRTLLEPMTSRLRRIAVVLAIALVAALGASSQAQAKTG